MRCHADPLPPFSPRLWCLDCVSKAGDDKHGGVKRKEVDLGGRIPSPRGFEAREKTGDRIVDGVRNGIKAWRGGDGRDLTLGIQGIRQH